MIDKRRSNYRFDEFELDLAKRRLMRDGQVVALKPKVFDLLAVLVENNGKLLTKDDIFRLVWGDQFVEETNLTVSISAIRRALGETANEPRYITNVSGRGYYFTGNIVENGLIAESRSFSRIVVESEPFDGREEGRRQLTAGGSRKAFLIGAAVLGALAIFAAAYALIFSGWERSDPPFSALSVTRATTIGRVTTAALAPDGRMFAFVRQEPDASNSLWIARIDGSEQLQLRQPGPKPVTGLSFSADGTKVYFVESEIKSPGEATLYRVSVLGGFVEKVIGGIQARIALSPDNKSFVFVRRDAPAKKASLIVGDTDGGGMRELASIGSDVGTLGYFFDWSPNGEYVAVPVYFNSGPVGTCELFAVSTKDGSLSQITHQGWSALRSVAWTKDSKGLIAVAGEDSEVERPIWYVPFPTGEPRKLLADSSDYGSLSLSADNASILAVQNQSISNIWVAPSTDLAAAKQITFDMLGKQSGWNSVEWTNDDRIVFTGRTAKSDILWEISADGTGQKQVLPEGKKIESISLPDDGSFVVFTSNRSGGLEIWRANRDGSDAVQLTQGGRNENPHVSPDGRYIIYRAGLRPDGRLMRMAPDGKDPVVLTEQFADWARVSPDSQMIACSYEVDGRTMVAILSVDGGPPLKIFDIPETANVRLGVRWTPDGRSITYRDWQNGIWKQEIVGGKPSRLEGLPAEKLFAYAWSRDGKWFAYGRGSVISDVVLLNSLQ